MMATVRIEADKNRVPQRVFHDFGRERWTHEWLEECELCERLPRFTLANRKAVLETMEATDEA